MDITTEVTNCLTFPNDELAHITIYHSYLVVRFYYKSFETDFEKKINTHGLLNKSIMDNIGERIKFKDNQEPYEIEIYSEEFIQLYTWHYIAACCANDKEAFFKYFIENDIGINNSESYREWFYDTQTAFICFYEQKRNLWNTAFAQHKNYLQKIFGVLSMNNDGQIKNYDL